MTEVRRVTITDPNTGNILEGWDPPHDSSWSPLQSLRWWAAVCTYDVATRIEVEQHGRDDFALIVGAAVHADRPFMRAWEYLAGIRQGIELVRKTK